MSSRIRMPFRLCVRDRPVSREYTASISRQRFYLKRCEKYGLIMLSRDLITWKGAKVNLLLFKSYEFGVYEMGIYFC